MTYEEVIFNENSLTKVIAYNNQILTKKEFNREVSEFSKKVLSAKIDNEFIFIKNDNPIYFYILVFTLWKNNLKVVFPNKYFLDNQVIPEYCKYVITTDGMSLDITENCYYKQHDIPSNIDTILFSSGSTGIPKAILHTKNTFLQNAISTANIISENEQTSITYLRPYLISALSHFFVHWITDSLLIFDDYINIENIGKYRDLTKNLNLVGSPMHLITAYKYMKDKFEPHYIFSSGDVINSKIIKDFINTFNESTFYKVYGLAELGGRLYISKFQSTNDDFNDIGKNLDIMDVKFENSEVLVKTNHMFYGYYIDQKFIEVSDYFKTGDIVENIGSKVYLMGRKNDEVKVMGNKVQMKFLENKVTESLSSYGIDFVVIVAIPHESFGNLIALVITKKISKSEIINSIRDELKAYEIPHQFFYVKDIPFTQTMKIDRVKLSKTIQNNEADPLK